MKVSETSHQKTESMFWFVSFWNRKFRSGQQTFVVEGLGGKLHIVETAYQMVIVSRPFLHVLDTELLWNCIIKHYKDNCNKVVAFLLAHVICKNFARLCRNLRIMWSDVIIDQLWEITPSHNIRGPVKRLRLDKSAAIWATKNSNKMT